MMHARNLLGETSVTKDGEGAKRSWEIPITQVQERGKEGRLYVWQCLRLQQCSSKFGSVTSKSSNQGDLIEDPLVSLECTCFVISVTKRRG